MTAFASAGIDLRAVRNVTCETLRYNTPVSISRVERLFPRVRVTARGLARFRRRFGSFLSMWIVTRSTLSTVRISFRIEIGKNFLHLVTAETL